MPLCGQRHIRNTANLSRASLAPFRHPRQSRSIGPDYYGPGPGYSDQGYGEPVYAPAPYAYEPTYGYGRCAGDERFRGC